MASAQPILNVTKATEKVGIAANLDQHTNLVLGSTHYKEVGTTPDRGQHTNLFVIQQSYTTSRDCTKPWSAHKPIPNTENYKEVGTVPDRGQHTNLFLTQQSYV